MDKPLKLIININSAFAPAEPIHRRVHWFNINLITGRGDEYRRDDFNVCDPYISKAQYRYNHFRRIRLWIKHYLYV